MQLALDDVERHSFAREFDGVGVAQLVRREAPPDAGALVMSVPESEQIDRVDLDRVAAVAVRPLA